MSRVYDLTAQAARDGAHLVLPSELFATPYFCKAANASYRDLARPAQDNPLSARFQTLARDTETVIPLSFYERAGEKLYNSVAVIDADGSVLGIYRKCHIPDFDGYIETAYFDPSPDGPQVSRHEVSEVGRRHLLGPVVSRTGAGDGSQGCQLLVYPTAIGSEPQHPDWDSAEQWQSAMRGHAASNIVPVLASNRVGSETDDGYTIAFYGMSFVCDHRAHVRGQRDRTSSGIPRATLDLDRAARDCAYWGTFQTRQPRNYAALVDTPAGPQPA